MTKLTKWHVRPVKTQISLGIRPVWSKSSLCTQWVAKDPSFPQVGSEDWSDWASTQADLSLHWAHMQFCWFCHSAAYLFSRNIFIGKPTKNKMFTKIGLQNVTFSSVYYNFISSLHMCPTIQNVFAIIFQSGVNVSLSRTSILSRSMTDLYKSSENISATGG